MATNAKSLLFSSASMGPVGDVGLLILRVAAGLALAFGHGINKIPPAEGFIGWIGGFGFPAPAFFAWMSGFAEFVCGLLIVIGLLTRPAAFFVTINFIVAQVFAHAGDSFGDRELPFLFLFIAVMYLFTGAGRYSIDALISGRRAR